MGFSDAIQWWEEWQLRVLVLCSLFLQCFLFIAATLRKRGVPSWFRFLIWLAYLGSDAVAIYALATLFNRHKNQQWVTTHHTSSTSLQVLWVPILLVHLGGQDGITAYNIEDNELWRRHVLTAVSQVAVAVYVFVKSLSENINNKIILGQAILLFFGVLKCLLKPWDLKRVSINNLVGSSGTEKNGKISSLQEYVHAATQCFHTGSEEQTSSCSDQGKEVKDEKLYELFVDLPPTYDRRLKCLKHLVQSWVEFWRSRGSKHGHRLVQSRLSSSFDRLYTKKSLLLQKVVMDMFRLPDWNWISFLRSLAAVSIATVFVLFYQSSRQESYDGTDVKITLTLLVCTSALEYIIPSLRHTIRIDQWLSEKQWPDQVAQYNLIGYLVRNKNHRKHRKLATLLVCKDYLDQLWCMQPRKSSCDITELICAHVRDGWLQTTDITSYHRFNDNRGQWTLGREGLLKKLDWSLRMPFDESVLVWHLATDFCFHHMDTPPAHEAARRSRVMSNYMAYLLFVNPEMLMAGARRRLFRTAYKVLKAIPGEEGLPLGEKELTRNIIRRMKDVQDSSLVLDAWAIAQELIRLQGEGEGEKKVWKVIQGVWVEMLCFSAGRCRGYLHAKSMGNGGEFLSYVWLLLSEMGMETLADRLQRTELPEEGDNVGAAAGRRRGGNPTAVPTSESDSPVTTTNDENV